MWKDCGSKNFLTSFVCTLPWSCGGVLSPALTVLTCCCPTPVTVASPTSRPVWGILAVNTKITAEVNSKLSNHFVRFYVKCLISLFIKFFHIFIILSSDWIISIDQSSSSLSSVIINLLVIKKCYMCVIQISEDEKTGDIKYMLRNHVGKFPRFVERQIFRFKKLREVQAGEKVKEITPGTIMGWETNKERKY